MKYPIDLGSKPMNERALAKTSPMKEKFYPTLHLEWEDEYDLPKSGTMKVTFNRTSKTTTTHNGKTRYNVTLEIKTIEEASKKSGKDEDDAPEHEEESTGDRLDKLAKEADNEENY